MPSNHRVSVAWQIVFTFLPIVNFWAFYRVRKLRKAMVYVFIPEVIISVIVSYSLFGPMMAPMSPDVMYGPDGMPLINPDGTTVRGPYSPLSSEFWSMSLMMNAIGFAFQGLAIYLIIIWSRHHNKQFDQPTKQTQSPP